MISEKASIAGRRPTAGKATADSASLADQLVDELGPLMAGERAAFAHRCHERQISMAYLFLMMKIDANGPLPMTRVAELIGSGLPTATGLVSRMEERGLVRREHDTHDRRVVLVSLTLDGTEEIRGLHAARRQRLAAAINHLTDAERAQLLSSLRALRAAIERAEAEGDLS
jgi:DNA-binding MarR family transcriptional regulator